MYQSQQPPVYGQNPNTFAQTGAQRYVYVDPGRQPYINPAFIPNNQNYYTSPVIPNPPARQTASNYGMYDPYANYYNSYNQYNCGCQTQYNYGCGGCQGQYYGQQYSPYGYSGYNQYGCGTPCGGGCGGNCHEYGLSINRGRITPKFPEKLGHSFVTSGDKVENKLVINEPTSESAPFQTQRRKTYLPYTRKYLEYQDYVQYVPVQKSEWAYKKVMKQIDFVPQEYYVSSVQMIPREKVDHKVRYIPVEKQIVHVPQQTLARQNQARVIEQRQVRVSNQSPVQSRVLPPKPTSSISFVHRNPAGTVQPVYRSSSPQQSVNFARTVIEQNRASSFIRPAQSTVEMVPNARLQPFNQLTSQRTAMFGVNNPSSINRNGYEFPQTGGVMIGGSSHQEESSKMQTGLDSFGPGVQSQGSKPLNVLASQVVHSGLGNQVFGQNRESNTIQMNRDKEDRRNFRQSNHVESEDFNFDPNQFKKQNSIVNRFEEDSN